jgi:hypothetical protein
MVVGWIRAGGYRVGDIEDIEYRIKRIEQHKISKPTPHITPTPNTNTPRSPTFSTISTIHQPEFHTVQ